MEWEFNCSLAQKCLISMVSILSAICLTMDNVTIYFDKRWEINLSFIPDGPLALILEYAPHGSLKHFLDECCLSISSAKHHPTRTPLQSSSSTASSSYPLLGSSTSSEPHTPVKWEKMPLSAQTSVFSTHSYATLGGPAESQTTTACADDVFNEDGLAFASDELLSPVNNICPVTHDYINIPKKLAREDVRNFALQIATGLSHLAEMKVCLLATGRHTIANFAMWVHHRQ